MTGWMRRGWDMNGADCTLVLKRVYSPDTPPGHIMADARVFYGMVGDTAVALGRFLSRDVKNLKALASIEARKNGFFPRSNWLPFEEEFPSGGETW